MRRTLLPLLLLATLVGCASTPRDTDAPAQTTTPAPPAATSADQGPASFLALNAFDGRTGQPLDWATLVDRAAAAQVVLIGEEHDLTPAQLMAADLFSAILAKRPGAALSLEFFERDHQIHLDDYLAGLTTTDQFRAATRRSPGNDPEGHRLMLEAAKAAGVPVIASNAPRRYVRIARLEGYERLARLSPEQRATFVVPRTMPSGRYRDDFIALMTSMGDHSQQPGPQPSDAQRRSAAEATFRSQALWDSTMAHAIHDALNQSRRPVVHVIGRFHTDFDGGTLQLLRRLRPSARVLTLSCQRATHTTLQQADRNRADIVIYADDPPTPDTPADPAP